MTRPVLIMAGGTGGHVFPALAVAEKLKEKNIPVVWLGTKKGIEARLVVDAGIKMRWLSVSGLRGKNKLSLILAPLKLLRACVQAMWVLITERPAVVLGMGGFVSGPGGLMSVLFRKPLLIHEQNAIPGLTNRLLAKMADTVIESFPDSFDLAKPVQLVGNPVRNNIIDIESPEKRMQARDESLNVLVVGGSLGAAVLNQTVPEMLALIADKKDINVWHQTGKKNFSDTVNYYKENKVEAKIDAFIDNMAAAYQWADVVICRAGAMTISELSMAGVASILVPYPYAVDDHQTANARFLVDKQAAILLQQDEMSSERLKTIVLNLNREKILQMSVAAKKISKPDAANKVAELCLQAGGMA